MGNVLTRHTSADARYTEFENNQVLTADQLNDIFRYLDIQSRLTRTRGIGVGIIYGLEIGVTDQNAIIVSKGSAITTDGDCLYFPNDQVFDQFSEFKDDNARYEYFHLDDGKQIPIFELSNSKSSRATGKAITQFDQLTSSALKDYVGILYQEDYNNDTDMCTGADCDNKGIECVRDLKVLIAHKDQVGELLKSIPAINQQYFALDDIEVPRVMLNKNINQQDELRGAFATALGVKEEIREKLQKAYEVCKALVEDDLDGEDPPKQWGELLEKHFKQQTTIYSQYLFDFARDLSYAYNEMRESLFNDNSIAAAPVELFPKHVLMGLVRTATVKQPAVFREAVPAPATQPRLRNFDFSKTVKFDIASLIRRFHPVHIDIEYRHPFYESPVLNNKDENTERTRFAFKRIDAMIRNFDIPTAEDLQSVDAVRILPSLFEDRRLGERTIPFYYKYNRSMAINAYWNFDANVRKKENQLYYYFSSQYSGGAAAKDPLKLNLLPYTFYRVEGHIGYKYPEVEAALNKIIDQNNLPINIISVQIENDIRTIPGKNWWFPHIQVYEQFVRNTFVNHLQEADMVHTSLKEQTNDDADKVKINLAMDKFTAAKSNVLTHKTMADSNFKIANFRNDVSEAIKSATDIKVQTQKFSFSNTAAPHDFVINTDILHKTDLLADLLDKQITKKKEGLLLANYMKKNPGLEHAGGVLRGGTFVLVYTATDQKVVADFMLPYASVDNDIVPDPPILRPLPIPERPTFELPKVFEKIPPYKRLYDESMITVGNTIKRFDDNAKELNLRFSQKVSDMEDTRKILNDKADGLDLKMNERFKLFDETKNSFDVKVKEVDQLYTRKLVDFESKLDFQGKVVTNLIKTPSLKGGTEGKLGGVVIGGRSFAKEAETIQKLSIELDKADIPPAERTVKEQLILEATKSVTDALAKPDATVDPDDAIHIKALITDMNEAAEKVQPTTVVVATGGQPAFNRATILTGVRGSFKNLRTRMNKKDQ